MTISPKRTLLRLLPVLMIAASVAVAALLIRSREKPNRQKRENLGLLVETQRVEKQSHVIEVEAQGTVRAARRMVVQPQVSGQVVWISEQLIPGGVVEKGEPLFRIEARDYRLALAESETGVEQAKVKLTLERGQQRVAKKEWELFRDRLEPSQAEAALALREPQMKVVEVSLDAAKSRLERAQLNLARTTVRAPFNLVVESESVEIGQLVSPQSQVAHVLGSDAFWVQVSVPVDRLGLLQIPGVNAKEGGRVQVVQEVAGKSVVRSGRVEKLLSELDPVGRMARVLVTIDDPLNLTVAKDAEPRGFPFLIGAYVSVRFGTAEDLHAVELERHLVHDGNKVNVYRDGALEVREVEILWRRRDTLLLGRGLADGDEVIVSRIAAAVPGTPLRKADDPAAAATGPAATMPGEEQ